MIGIMNGMVMQRNIDNVADILITSESKIKTVSFEGKVCGTAKVTDLNKGQYRITDIPVGGPYKVNVDGEVYTDIYVGDLWILAGQSNMQGVGWLSQADKTDNGNSDIRALYMQDYWAPAVDPLHLMWHAKDKIHVTLTQGWDIVPDDQTYQGVGPGVSFARRMYELHDAVPQGLLCCAHGGTSLTDWSPKIKDKGPDESLYAAMLRRYKANGSNVRGMFWYQGCAEGFSCEGDVFTEKMKTFMDEFHSDFGNIPTVQVQIARVVHKEEDGFVESWVKIREAQRLMDRHIDNLYTISAINKPLDDIIHLSRDAQNELGAQAAETMYYALHGTDDKGFIAPPEFDGIVDVHEHPQFKSMIIKVKFKNLKGELTSLGRPTGFMVTHNKYDTDVDGIISVRLYGDIVEIRTSLNKDQIKDTYLYYGFGFNPYCNITDQKGREMPCFGPIKIS